MTSSSRLAAALSVLLVTSLSAQQPPQRDPANPYGVPPPGVNPRVPPVSQPPASMQANGGVAGYPQPPGYGGGGQVPPPQYYPYSPPAYFQTPANGYLTGVADVTTAQGNYLSQVQQARLQQTQADSAKLDLKRKIAEQQQYMRAMQPTPDEVRQKEIGDAINRARNNPPATEIWSGVALNSLLIAIQREQRGGMMGPAVPISPDVLRHINFTTGATVGGSGAARQLTRFQWPDALQDDAFNDQRTKMEQLAREAVSQATSGPISTKLINGMRNDIRDITNTLKSKVDDFTPTQYVQAKRYLGELSDAVRALQDPNVAGYFSDRFQATGNTVAELVQSMTSRGVTFAPAASGDEPYYTTLHGAMVTYDYGLYRLANR